MSQRSTRLFLLGARRCAARACVALALLALVCAPARASLFDVNGVAVSAEAGDAVQAKQEAMAAAAVQALQTLMRRLTRADDYDRLPAPDAASIGDMVSGITVVKELAVRTHYSATLNLRFEPESIRVLLGHAGVGFVERVAEPVLVVPVYKSGDIVALWEENPYLAAWRRLDTANSLTPVRLPTANIKEQGVSPEAVLANDYDAMFALRYLYDAKFVLVSVCDAADPGQPMQCVMRGDAPAGPVDFAEQVTGGEDAQTLTLLAAQAMLARLELQWKSASITGPLGGEGGAETQSQTLPMSVSFQGLREWQDLRARLAAVPGVSSIEIAALNARGADLNVSFLGTLDQFAQMLSAQNLQLVNAGERWMLQAY